VVAVSDTGAERTILRETINWLDGVQARMANFMVTDRVRRTTAALEAIGNHVATVPGRKNLIWISSGFPLSYGMASELTGTFVTPDRMSFYAEAERTVRALNNAGLVIYPVEARGVFDAFSQNPRLTRGVQHHFRGDPVPVLDTKVDDSDRDSMIMLAQRTGGKAYYNTNDLSGAIRNAVDDSAGSYTLAYYPSHGEWFNQWRRIKIRVKRPGVQLRHRPGYYALPEPTSTKTNRFALTLSAASSPLEATALGLTARPEFTDSSRTMLKILIDVESRGLQLQREQGNRFVGAFDVSFTQFDREGRRLRYLTQTVDMKLTSKTLSAMHKDGLVIERLLELVLGTTEVRVAVRDPATGLTGSLSIPLDRVQPVRD
jgi:hypothetical protein